MNQVQLIVDIDEVFFDQIGAYQVTFQHQYSTELVQDVKSSPKFETNHFDIITVADTPEALNLNVLVEDHQSGAALIKAKTVISLSPSSQFQDKEIVFTDSFTGFILIKYKTIPATSGRIIRTLHDKDYVLNVTVGYINTLMENPYRLKVTLLTTTNQHLHALQLNNTFYHSVSKVSGKYGQDGLIVRIQELDIANSQVFVTRITNSAPSVVYITLGSGDIVTVTFKFSDIEHNHIVGIVHSSVMREGSISTGPNEDKPRLSLSPRRRSSIVTPRSSMRNSKIAGAMKQLLYLEDESLEEHTSSEEILHRLGGKLAVAQENTNSTESLQTPVVTSRNIEAANGTYIFSTSRSDVIEEENAPKTKHMKRKDMQNIVLGLLKLHQSYVTNPLKLRATLSDVLFLEHPDEKNPEKLIRQPRSEIRYTGQLVETSREIFSESGLVTCALEGKLYIENSQLRDDQYLRQHLSNPITEKIMVFKIILSLIHFDAAEGGKDDPFKSTTDSIVEENNPPNLATPSIDTILENAMSEHRDKVQQLQEENKFNVVTEETAKDDGEMIGESEMNIPIAKQKLTPIPSGAASKEHSNTTSKTELPTQETESKQSSNKNSKVSLKLPPEGGEEGKESEESKGISKVSSKHPSNKSSHQSLPPPQGDPELPTNTAATSFAELPSLPISHKPSQEELYALQRNRTGEIEGFSQAFGEGITVEDIIKHRLSKQNLKENPESFSLPSQAIEPNKKNIILFAQMIKEELLEKQRLVESLLQENKDKYKAIQLVGQDIKQLREENQRLKKSVEDSTALNQQYETEKSQATSIFQDYLDTGKPLEGLSNTTLIHTLAQLYSDHKQLQHQYQQSQELITTEQQRIAQLSKEKDELQQLHQQVSSQYQQLQQDFHQRTNEFEKLSYYQLTIQTQEKIINKLQTLLESKMKNKFHFLKEGSSILPPNHLLSSKDYSELQQLRAMVSQKKGIEATDQKPEASTVPTNSNPVNNNNEYEKLVQEVFEKTNQLQSQQQEIVLLNHKVEELENQIDDLQKAVAAAEEEKNRPNSATSFNADAYNEVDIQEILERNQYGHRPSSINNLKKANLTVDKLTADNLSKGFKIEALEKQLETSSRESAREIARLRTKLFELEMAAIMASNGITENEGFDDIDLLSIPSANTSSKTNKTNTLLTTSKPSSAAEKQRPSIVPAINLGRSRNTILEDLEERNSPREQPHQLTGKVYDSNPGELVVNVEKPDNTTIPRRIPSTKILRNESVIDEDRIPTPNKKVLQPEAVTTETKPKEGDLLHEIMNDIHNNNPRKSSIPSSSTPPPEGRDMMKEILQDINH